MTRLQIKTLAMMGVCILALVVAIFIVGCSADVKIQSKPADRVDTVVLVRHDSAWKYLDRNGNITDADSAKIGECMLYRGYFHGYNYRHLQCPSWVRTLQNP